MKARFLADADLNQDIVKGVLRREPGIDFRVPLGAEVRSRSDLEVLALAASEGRILLTHDRKTMPLAFAEFVGSANSPGVFIISQKVDHLAAIEAILLVWAASEAEEWANRVCAVPL
jgi:predicted nuclease of predicted toxin-antitoxin system